MFAVFLFGLTPAAEAHLMPAKQGTINIVDKSVYVVLTVPVSAVKDFDDNHDGAMDLAEISRHQKALNDNLGSRIALWAASDAGVAGLTMVMSPQTGDQADQPTNYLLLMHERTFKAPPTNLHMKVNIFGDAADQKQIAMRAKRGAEAEMVVLTSETTDHVFFKDGWSTFQDFVGIGVRHILLGLDHLLFLVTILAIGVSLRQWMGVVTTFTIAHSITLTLAATGVAKVSPSLVEPMIALSIVAMAIDNLTGGEKRPPAIRVGLVFGCGLLHGLGFAGSIADFGLDKQNWLASLVGFNVGIEVGQAIFLGGLLALVGLSRALSVKLPARRLMQTASAIAVIAGGVLMWQRTIG
jgi:hydrogenase/urease accessory protein HupE